MRGRETGHKAVMAADESGGEVQRYLPLTGTGDGRGEGESSVV